MPKISVVIACRAEADTLWFTINSIQMHQRGPLLDRDGMEIVVADNEPGKRLCQHVVGGGRPTCTKQTCGPTVKEVVAGFGSSARFPVRYVDAGAVKSPYYPRMAGAAAAEGEHLIFLDAHILLSPFTIEGLHRLFILGKMDDTFVVKPRLYMAHIPVGFDRPNRLFGPYKLRLRGDFWGGWTSMNDWPMPPASHEGIRVGIHPIGAAGIWCFSTSKESWEAVKGFNSEFVGYAGGEVYLQMKYWLLGGHVVLLRCTDDRTGEMAFGTHWSAPRRYSTYWPERIRNVLLGVSVVAPDLLDTVGATLMTKSGVAPVTLARLRTEAVAAGIEEASWLASNRVLADTAALEQYWTANQVFF